MLFNSYEFIFIYLPITFFVYFALAKFRKTKLATGWLVFASIAFYGYWDISYVPLLMASICFNYFVGVKIEQTNRKKQVLTFGIVCNLLLLGYFKYTDFFLTTLNDINVVQIFDLPHIILPLGISFFTFTQTAYLIDAYRGETKHYSFMTYCLFVTIFPHLIAGPIINHKDMIPQFSRLRNFVVNYRNISMGISLFTLGLFKKVMIADNLSPWVNEIFSKADTIHFVEAWCGAFGYTFQLYFDFSAYSEMAIGLGLLFNFRFPQNFDSPYQSTSIIDFWRHWHMTLGYWVKHYLYIPMGGNRLGEFKKMRNLFVSMFLIGLWHGAGWTFIIWGIMHGCMLMVNHQWRRLNLSMPKPIAWPLTFLCVTLAWVIFKAADLNEAMLMYTAMTDIHQIVLPTVGSYAQVFGFMGDSISYEIWQIHKALHNILLTLLGLFIAVCLFPNPVKLMRWFKPNWKWFILTLLLLLLTLYHMNTFTEFLYFQF